MSDALITKLSRLVDVELELEFVGAKHLLLLPPLVSNVCTHRILRNVANGSGVITATPKRGKPGAQGRKLASQYPTGSIFEPVHYLSDAPSRIELKRQVNMIGHDFQCVDRHIQVGRFFAKQGLSGDLPLRHSILGGGI